MTHRNEASPVSEPSGVGPFPWNYFAGFRKDANLPGEMLDALKFECDMKMSYYGSHFRAPYDTHHGWIGHSKSQAAFILRSLRAILRRPPPDARSLILSNAYFSTGLELEKLGYRVQPVPWEVCDDPSFLPTAVRIRHALRYRTILELCSTAFVPVYRKAREALRTYLDRHDVRAVVMPSDTGFFESLATQAMRERGCPSFIFLHGLPGRYNRIDDGATDHILVWGERIRRHYLDAGVAPERVLVTGHPAYQVLPENIGRRWGFEDVLVLSKAMNGAQNRRETLLTDRGNLLTYVLGIQRVLGRLGIGRFRVRLHPSENPDWYRRELRSTPIEIDGLPLSESLQRSSLVIGPTSTVFLETLINGGQYLIFEPAWCGFDMMNNRMVPPFDGSDPRVPVASDEAALEAALRQGRRIDADILHEYIRTPFDFGVVRDRIEQARLSEKRS